MKSNIAKCLDSKYNSMQWMGEEYLLEEICENAGDLSAVISALEDAGKAGLDGIHAYIDKGIPSPNSPITLSGGWMRNPVSGKPMKVKGKSGTTPLVDTGQLYNDFDWEITGK
jgi:hypothetical protein